MNYIGEISALSAAFLWSFSSIVFTSATIRIGSIQLNISRMVIACIFLLLTIPLFNIDYEVNFWQIFYLSVSGFVGLTLGDTFLFKSFEHVGPRIGMLIMSSNPTIAALLAYLILGEVLTVWGVLGIIITLSGISIVIMEKPKVNRSKFKITRIGLIYAFLGAAGQGTGLIFAKMANNIGEIHSLVATFIRILAAVIIMLPMVSIAKKYTNPFKVFAKDKMALGMVTLGAIIGPYLGITFSYLAIINTQVGIASTIMATMPIIMLPLSWFFYKEKLSWKSILGAFVAVFGVAILFLRKETIENLLSSF